MVVRSMPASRSQKLSVPNTSSSGNPAEKPRNSMRSVAASAYTCQMSRQEFLGEGRGSSAEGVLSDMAISICDYYSPMCFLCDAKHSAWPGRRAFLLAAAGTAAAAATTPLRAQVDVGPASQLRHLAPADEIETAATQEYSKLLAEARAKGALAPQGNPQLQRLRTIAARLVPQTAQWNDRAKQWRWEVNLLGSREINAFCMPGGKIAFYTGILEQLKLTDDEAAMIMGHEMAHALREHA